MYWALYLPLVCLPTILLLQVRHRLRSRKLLPLAVNLGWAILVTAIFFVPYLKNSSEYGFHREEPNPVPVDRYFDVLPGNLLYSEWLGTARANENAAHFLGFTALGLGLIGLFACSSKTDEKPNWYRPLFVFFIVAGFFLSLGTEIRLGEHKLGPGPYAAFFQWMPGFQNIRYPERLSILLILGLAPMVAIGLDRVSHRLGKLAVGVVGGILFLEHLSIPLQLAHLAHRRRDSRGVPLDCQRPRRQSGGRSSDYSFPRRARRRRSYVLFNGSLETYRAGLYRALPAGLQLSTLAPVSLSRPRNGELSGKTRGGHRRGASR